MHTYRIFPRRGGREYLLEGGGGVLGALVLKSIHRHKAVVKIGQSETELTRQAIIKKHVHMGHESGEIHFSADSMSRGTLTLHGTRYQWTPMNLRWTEWAWHAEGHSPLIVGIEDGFFRPHGKVRIENGLRTEDDILLVLFGWYLLLLNHQSFGRHLLHALTFRKSKLVNQ